MIAELREQFNRKYSPDAYRRLLAVLEEQCRGKVDFRIAETPIFVERGLLDRMADAGIALTKHLIGDAQYLAAAREAIPPAYRVPAETTHPHFLTADFALVREVDGSLGPRLVEIQAFPSVYGFQAVLSRMYQDVYEIGPSLGRYLCKFDKELYWKLMAKTVLGKQDPENVVLTEVDPTHQKTRPDFEITARKLGITVVDITTLEPVGNKLHYRNQMGKLVPIGRIYNRAIADELISRGIRLPFDMTREWDVEWAGHPNWYFLISKFSLPWLTQTGLYADVVPPAVFVSDFLEGPGRQRLKDLGVPLPENAGPETAYSGLLLKPLFSFAGKGIQFEPTQGDLEAIPTDRRKDFLLQQRMSFVSNIETPFGPTQAEIRILYLWPEDGNLTPVLPLVRLGRGKMMGVDHNRNQEWVGASAAFIRG